MDCIELRKKPDWTARYPGLSFNGKIISDYFPVSKRYVEPFSGLARTAKYARAPEIILNDMSDYANKICKKKHPSATITHQDFADCIKRWDGPDTFFLIDPPWKLEYYRDENEINKLNGKPVKKSSHSIYDGVKRILDKKEKGMMTPAVRRKVKYERGRQKEHERLTMFHGVGETPAFIDRSVKEYMKDLERVLDKVVGHYIVTLSPINKFYAPFKKDVRNPRAMLFGGHPTNTLYSNKPLKIRINQITNYF